MLDRAMHFAARVYCAVRYYQKLGYSWRLAWVKSYRLETL